MDSLIAANSKFCFDLFQEISKNDGSKNIFFCPLSISAALGMVRLGARSDSAQQIDQVRPRQPWVHSGSQAPSGPTPLWQATCSLHLGSLGASLTSPLGFLGSPTLLPGSVNPASPGGHFSNLTRLTAFLTHLLCVCLSACQLLFLSVAIGTNFASHF